MRLPSPVGFVGRFLLVASMSTLGSWAASEAPAPPETIRIQRVTSAAMAVSPNLLTNAGFEATTDDGMPAGWHWDRRNTDATCESDAATAHGGRRSVRLTNGTAFGAHVYGMLWARDPIQLQPGRRYTLSAWVRSADPGIVTLIGGARWQHRAVAPPTGDTWRRIAVSFTADETDRDFIARINTESPTAAAWVDDVKLEAGPEPTPDPPADTARPRLDADPVSSVIEGDGPFRITFLAWAPRDLATTAEVRYGSGESSRVPVVLARGFQRLAIEGTSLGVDDAPRSVTLRIEGLDRDPIEATAEIRLYSTHHAEQRLAALRACLPAIQRGLGAVKARGQDPSYPRITATVMENFLAYADEDAHHGAVRRALSQLRELDAMATRLQEDLAACADGRLTFPPVPRWTGHARPVIRGSSFLGPVCWPDGSHAQRPIFFTGYGHFGRVVADLEKWPAYGTNIIQIELGPSRIFPRAGATDEAPVRELRATLDRAQEAGVAVCLLISPHYMPDWALAEWPHLRRRRDGFLQYCLHAPEGQELLRRHIEVVLGPLKDHPALHSICLSNEPVNKEEPCEAARQDWQTWLRQRHGDLARLNARQGAHYAIWDEVPLPDPFRPPPARGLLMDYIRFNEESFARWHARLAEAVHRVAPGLPVHAKAMTWTMLNDGDVGLGVDATLFGSFSDINGNDGVNFYAFGQHEFAQGWLQNAMGHDLQRSVCDAPVFNSENHVIADRETRPVPAGHIRAALWQAAVHGQSATTIWVWERTLDPKSDFAGSILERPACAEAVGRVNCDLNRAAVEVTALQQAPPDVLLLHSTSGLVWDGGRHSDCRDKLYTALACVGLKVGFVTERQLESGGLPTTPVLFVPDVVHLSEAARATLARYKGRLVLVGGTDLLSRDEYDRACTPITSAESLAWRHGQTSARDLWQALWSRLGTWGVSPRVTLRSEAGKPVWGVCGRSVATPDGLILNVCNYAADPASFRVIRGPEGARVRDVLTGAEVVGTVALNPLEVRLLRIEGP
jgi:hypothetical protein